MEVGVHLLYVVEFDVEAATTERSAYEPLLGHVARWLSRGSITTISETDLSGSGTAVLPPADSGSAGDIERTATWEVLAAGDHRALRVSVQHPLDTGVELTTRVTISDVSGRTVLRVGMSREHPSGALTPVRATPLFQPGIVREVAEDENLTLAVAGHRVDTRFVMVRDPGDVGELVTTLRSAARLPILLVHMRSLAGRDAAYIASRKLIGLARVVSINQASREALARELPGLAVPFGGARLVWSELEVTGPSVPAAQIEGSDREVLREALMPRLAPVSALANGIDNGWRRVRQASQRSARGEAESRLRLAQETADITGQRDALEEKVVLLEADLEDTRALADAYAAEATELKGMARLAEDRQVELEYWKDLYLGRYESETEVDDELDLWKNIPALVPGSDPSDTFLALSDASGSSIAFTEAAERSWKKISYPHPDDMTAALTSLARAAQTLYGAEAVKMGHVDEWFKTEFGLNVATADDTIEKTKTMRYFDYEGQRRDQTPHVKVRDAVKPNEVGRIHFAFDKDGGRLIVNHVALKLYGL